MARHRLGVVLVVPPPVDAEIDGLRRALGSAARLRIAPHVTLVPPVNVSDGGLDDALAVVGEAAAAAAPLRLRLGPAATFHPVTPVVFLAVGAPDGEPDALDRLHALRQAVFRPPLERPLTHPFRPHATVAEDVTPERIPAALAALVDWVVDVTVDRVHVLRQEGHDAGRVWRPVADVPFGAAPAVVGRGGLGLELAAAATVPPDATRLLAPAAGTTFAITARRPTGEPVGAASGRFAAGTCRLDRLVVAADDRRQGIGRHLLAAVEAQAAERGCAGLETEVVAGIDDVPAAVALLTSAGWHPADGAAADRSAGRWRRLMPGPPG